MRRQTLAAIVAAALLGFFVTPTFAADESLIVVYGATGKLGGNTVYVRSMEDAGTAERIVGAVFDVPADRDSDALALFCPTP